MYRTAIEMKISELERKVAKLEELLAEELLGVGANEHAGWEYGEGYFHDGGTKDPKAKKEYNINYYAIDENKSKFWGVKGKKD